MFRELAAERAEWLVPEDTPVAKGEDAKHEVVEFVLRLSREHKLGAGMSSGGLRTRYNPAMPMNFWLWEPQSPSDRAPTKTK